VKLNMKWTWAIQEDSPTSFYVAEYSPLTPNVVRYGPVPDRETARTIVGELRSAVQSLLKKRIPALSYAPMSPRP